MANGVKWCRQSAVLTLTFICFVISSPRRLQEWIRYRYQRKQSMMSRHIACVIVTMKSSSLSNSFESIDIKTVSQHSHQTNFLPLNPNLFSCCLSTCFGIFRILSDYCRLLQLFTAIFCFYSTVFLSFIKRPFTLSLVSLQFELNSIVFDGWAQTKQERKKILNKTFFFVSSSISLLVYWLYHQ